MIQMNHKRESHYKIILKAEKDLDKPKKLVPKTLDETKSEKLPTGKLEETEIDDVEEDDPGERRE